MPFYDKVESNSGSRYRLLVIGQPNCGKTTALDTWDPVRWIVASPTEKGTDILSNSPEQRVILWKPQDPLKMDWRAMREEHKLHTATIIRDAAKAGVTSLLFDGVHKIHRLYREALKLMHPTNTYRVWEDAASELAAFFNMGFASEIPYVAWTCWSTYEKVNPNDEKSSMAVWPEFMGKAQREIVGEVNVVYAGIEGGKGYWQLRPDQVIQGIGLKLPKEEAVKLPVKIEPSWQTLKKHLFPNQ